MARRIVAAALDEGINYVDTADFYGTWYEGTSLAEELLGWALKGMRERIVLGTKGCQQVGPGTNNRGASRYHLMNALEGSLRRLRTDHVDLYQIHIFDPDTPMEETMRTLDEMVRSGKVRYVGSSQYMAWQICRCNDLAEHYGWTPFITTQAHYNLLERQVEVELLPYCRATGVGLLAFFALANGLLAGRYPQGAPPPPDSRAAAFERTRRYLAQYATPQNYRAHRQVHRLCPRARAHVGRPGHRLGAYGAGGVHGAYWRQQRGADGGQRSRRCLEADGRGERRGSTAPRWQRIIVIRPGKKAGAVIHCPHRYKGATYRPVWFERQGRRSGVAGWAEADLARSRYPAG